MVIVEQTSTQSEPGRKVLRVKIFFCIGFFFFGGFCCLLPCGFGLNGLSSTIQSQLFISAFICAVLALAFVGTALRASKQREGLAFSDGSSMMDSAELGSSTHSTILHPGQYTQSISPLGPRSPAGSVSHSNAILENNLIQAAINRMRRHESEEDKPPTYEEALRSSRCSTVTEWHDPGRSRLGTRTPPVHQVLVHDSPPARPDVQDSQITPVLQDGLELNTSSSSSAVEGTQDA